MTDLILLGAGEHAPEIAQIVARINAIQPRYRLLGYIAADGQPQACCADIACLGGSEALAAYPQAQVVRVPGWPHTLPQRPAATLIDPSVFIAPGVRMGGGCVLYPNCFLGAGAVLGAHVFALSACIINHDDVIGDHTVLASQVALAGYVHVEPDCYLGQSCTVRQYLRIGRGALVGMGAVVVRDVPANVVVAGNPARVLRER